jgi:hypothetical protein
VTKKAAKKVEQEEIWKDSDYKRLGLDPELVRPDLKHCQVEKPNGVNFMTLGGGPVGGMVQCNRKPVWVVYQIENDEDGGRGAMSICDTCRPVLEQQAPELMKMSAFRKIQP